METIGSMRIKQTSEFQISIVGISTTYVGLLGILQGFGI